MKKNTIFPLKFQEKLVFCAPYVKCLFSVLKLFVHTKHKIFFQYKNKISIKVIGVISITGDQSNHRGEEKRGIKYLACSHTGYKAGWLQT